MIKLAPAPLFLLLFLLSPLRSETVDIEYTLEDRTVYVGSAVLFSTDLCVTAGHVVNFKEGEPVILKRNRRAINGTSIVVDKGADIAIIKMESKLDIPTLVISKGVEQDEQVVVECFNRTRKLIYYSIGTDAQTNTMLLIFNGKVENGMSGSPIFDNKGHLLSIVSGSLEKSQAAGCHPASLKEVIRKAKERKNERTEP